MIFAAVDVGSNAVRLLISDVYEKGDGAIVAEKTSLVRVPIRLGEDTFVRGIISDEKRGLLSHALHAFSNLFQVYRPVSYAACATSALREAENGAEVAAYVSRQSGIEIDIIDGKTEALIVGKGFDSHLGDTEDIYLFADVGGGSTDLSVSYRGNILELRSFKLGTVRILNNYDETAEWGALKAYLKELDEKFRKKVLVGSGGNINKISKLFGTKGSKELTYKEIDYGIRQLENMSMDERIAKFGLRHDRADVIVPAGTIFLTIMKHLHASRILVPRIGLVDGMIRALYHDHNGTAPLPAGVTAHRLATETAAIAHRRKAGK